MTSQSDPILFIGDSIIQDLDIDAICKNGRNYGMGGYTVRDILEWLPAIREISSASAVFLSVGINDFWMGAHAKSIQHYQAILEWLPNHFPVIINSVLPVDDSQYGLPSNREIDLFNEQLQLLVLNRSNCHYCNANSVMKDQENRLPASFHAGDGVHLSSRGYSVLINQIRQSLSSLIPGLV